MRTLFFYPLHAYSRIVRVMLAEEQLDFDLQYELPWNLSEHLQSYNDQGILPILRDINGTTIAGITTIMEYLDEAYPEQNLIGKSIMQRVEARRLSYWFVNDFYHEVYYPIMNEKIIKRFKSKTVNAPNPDIIRNALYKIPKYLSKVIYLLERRSWLSGRDFSMADICVASFLSVLDYLSILKWSNYDNVLLTWYIRIKSRRSFRSLLSDNVSTIPPSKNYAKLDY